MWRLRRGILTQAASLCVPVGGGNSPGPGGDSPADSPPDSPDGGLNWPKSADTGVRAGVTLTPYVGPATIVTPGTVISEKTISGTLTINADNVTVRDCLIEDFTFYGILNETNTGMLVEYCDIDGTGSSGTKAVAFYSGIVQNNDIRGMVIGVEFWGDTGTIQNNYIHDLADTSSDPDDRHFDGIVCRGGSHLSILNNAVDAFDGTAAIFLTSQGAALDDVLCDGNLATGQASYTIYGAELSTYAVTDVRITNNHIERGIFGYILNTAGAVNTGNTEWQDGVDPVPAAVVAWRDAE